MRRGLNRSLLLSLLFLPAVTTDAYAQKIRVGWVYAMGNAPVIVAEQKGLFKKYGLDVEVIEFTSGPLLFQSLAGQQIDIAYTGFPPVTHWYARGLKTTTVAKVNFGLSAVLVRKDSGIRTLADLKGKKIASVRKGSGLDALLRGFVLTERAGLRPETDVQIVSMPPSNMGNALINRSVDAAFMWEPFTTQYLLAGETKIIFDMNREEPRYPWYVVVVQNDYLKKHRDAVVRVLRAHKAAIEFLNSSETAGNDIIAARFRLGPVPGGRKVSGSEIARQARQRLGFEYRIGERDLAFFDRQIVWSRSLGFLSGSFAARDLVDLSLMHEAEKDVPQRAVKPKESRAR